MKLPPQVQQAFDRIDAMTLRERALVLGALVGMLFVAWDTAMMRPLNALHEARAGQLESLQQQLGDLNRAIQAAAGVEVADPDAAARRELAELRARLVEVDRRLTTLTGDMIEPAQMGQVLEQLLAASGGLELVSMHNIGAQALAGDTVRAGGYFRHGIALEVRGSFHATLRYLEAVEALPWRFFWERVELQVEKHPVSRTTIVLHTLSLREGLLGV